MKPQSRLSGAVLSQRELRKEVEKGEVRFDPPLEEKQWAEASVNLRLGLKFTKWKDGVGGTFSLSKGIASLTDRNLWHEETFPLKDGFGKQRTYTLFPNEFVLALTHEHVWIPRHLIAMVEGRSTFARVGLSMHQTAPWIQPGWDGNITLEMRNGGPLKIELTPVVDMPCQLTFFKLTSKLPKSMAYGSRPTHSFQSQTSALPPKKV